MRSCWDVIDRRDLKLTSGHWRIAVAKRQCNHEEVSWIRGRIATWEKEVRRM
jgi:hypothetical protein